MVQYIQKPIYQLLVGMFFTSTGIINLALDSLFWDLKQALNMIFEVDPVVERN